MTAACYHLGLIGYPLGHSRSPALHHAALAAYGLEGEYRLFAVPPGDEGLAQIRALLAKVAEQSLHGLNVTIPHKQAVMPYLDRLSAVARAVGAVNTIWRAEDGHLVGDNTDVDGFLRDVRRVVSGAPGRAAVLGAGGSARAVAYALARSGWQVTVLSRRLEQAAALAQSLAENSGQALPIATAVMDQRGLEEAARGCGLLVNTTPVGMHPHPQACPWPDDLPFPAGAAVYDLVYNPFDTLLVQRARGEGLRAASGAGMLVAQAALAFQLWTGLDAPFDVMEAAFTRSPG